MTTLLGLLFLVPALAGAPDLYQQSYEQEAVGAYGLAISSLDAMPSSARATYTWSLRRAWLLYLDGRYAESATTYDTAIRLAPRAVEPKLGKLLPLLAARRWADAERLGREVLDVDPKSGLARSRTAWALYNLGRYRDAADLYRSVLDDYPSDVEARAGLGWSLLLAGDASGARRELEAVLEVAPKHPTAAAGLEQAR